MVGTPAVWAERGQYLEAACLASAVQASFPESTVAASVVARTPRAHRALRPLQPKPTQRPSQRSIRE